MTPAYLRGFIDGMSKKESENPYEKGSKAHEYWTDGYCDSLCPQEDDGDREIKTE